MTWTVVFTHQARHDLRNLDSDVAKRVIRALDRYAQTQRGDVKRLRGYERERRLRVGQWRVRFIVDPPTSTLTVLRVLPRGQAYRE